MRIFSRGAVTKLGLRPSCDSWSHSMTQIIIGDHVSEILNKNRTFWAGSYKAHLSLQNIYELRHLIESPFPQKSPNTRDSRIHF